MIDCIDCGPLLPAFSAAAFIASSLSQAFLIRSSRFLASLESGTGLKIMSVREQEFPSPLFHILVKMADCERWHSDPSGFGGGLGSRGIIGCCCWWWCVAIIPCIPDLSPMTCEDF